MGFLIGYETGRPIIASWRFGVFLASCILFSGCGKLSGPPILNTETIADPPIQTATFPGMSQNETPIVSAVKTASPSLGNLSELKLQPITAQNINQIVPVAVLDDFGLYGSTLSPDGRRFAVSLQYSVNVYDTSTGDEAASFSTNGSALMAFSFDGSRLATLSARPNPPDVVIIRTDKSGTAQTPDRYVLTIWDIAGRRALFSKNAEELCGEKAAVELFQFLVDGSLALASLDYDTHIQSVCRIAAEDGARLDHLDIGPARGYVRSLALSSDGRTLAAAFSTGPMDYQNPVLALFRFPDGEVLFEKPVPVMPELAFVDPTQHLLYNTQNLDGQAAIDIITPAGDPVQSIPLPGDLSTAEWFTANERYLIFPGDAEAVVYDLTGGTKNLRIPYVRQAETIFPAGADARGYSQFALARSSDLLLIHQNCIQAACRDMDDMVRVIDLAHPNRDLARFELPFWFATASGGDLSPDGRLIAVGGLWNGEVRVWASQNGQLLTRLQGHQGLVYQAVFSPDGTRLATVSADGTARLWDPASGNLLYTLIGHQGGVLRAAFSPDGARLFTSGLDRTLRLWDLATGEELLSLPNPKPDYVVDGLWFTSENTLLLSVANLQAKCVGCLSTAFQLDIQSGSVIDLPWEHLLSIQSTAGDWLLRYGAGEQRVLDVGRMETGQLVVEKTILLTALNDSQEIALSPDGKLIYTFNANGLNVIDRATGEQIALAANYLGVQTSGNGRLEAAPDGRFLVDFTGGKVVLWGIPEP